MVRGNRGTLRIRSLRKSSAGNSIRRNTISRSECTEEQKNAPARESANQRLTRRKDRLIRLDDLIPKQDVKGGRQLLFGVTDVTQTTNPTKEN